jgi:hypothetical protein
VPAQPRPQSRAQTRTNRQSKPATVPRVSRVVKPKRPQTRSGRISGSYPVAEYQDTKRGLGQVSSATPKLAAEWLVCVLIIVASMLTRDGEYTLNMSEALWRITATTGVFFVLAVASMSKALSGVTVAFGALIMIAILFKSANEMKTVLDVASGKGSGATSDQLDADLDPGASTKVGHQFVQ